jgi:hypothetical protein
MALKSTIRFRISYKLRVRANRIVKMERSARQQFNISDLGREVFARGIAEREAALGLTAPEQENGKAVPS